MSERFWTNKQIEILKAAFLTKSASEIAEMIDRTVSSVHYKANRLGLKKSTEWIAERARKVAENPNHGGRKTYFKKGTKSWNKGMKGLKFAGSEKTHFKKGSIPHNHKPLGYKRINVEGYLEVKIAEPNKFVGLHREIWKQHYGEIPKGMIICFKDGNRLNVEIDNLEMISRKEARQRNSIHNLPEDLRLAIFQIARLKRRITNAKKHNG